MRKKNFKGRCEKRVLGKCAEVCRTYDAIQYAYLMELGDNSWLCVYFDDYLALIGTDTYPTGYVRYTTTEERRMLKQMAKDYDVDPVYVLDMYQHGKVNWMLDVLLRLAVCVAVAVIVWSIKKTVSKRRFLAEGE